MNRTGVIYGINGPVVYIKGNTGFKMDEMVYVGKEKLVGEVIGLDKDRTTIQVFERLPETLSPYTWLPESCIIFSTVLNVP